MNCRFGAPIAVAAASLAILPLSDRARAADLPAIRISATNTVAECATPGRLMAYVTARNPQLDPKYGALATEYMRHGEALELRWDYAFFQMLVETAYLAYTGDVKPEQNNFAGLGATGRGARGESFKDVSTGVRAHLEHVLMYTGTKIEAPVAERTRNVQEWGVLTSWQKTITGPMTFAQLAKQWAPTSRGYPNDIKAVADRFFNGICKEADPRPELVAEARKGTAAEQADTAEVSAPGVAADPAATQSRGAEIARRALDEARADGGAARTGLGAASLSNTAAAATPAKDASDAGPSARPPLTVLNPPPGAAASSSGTGAAIETASVAGAAKSAGKLEKPEKAPNPECRVWTASYGGAKALIVKAVADQTVNYTVLDVNEGSEKREADAFISAYAKGGATVGEFASQVQALDKAFELCPGG